VLVAYLNNLIMGVKMSKYIVTIEFESDWSHPRKWNLDEILSLEEGESAEILKIEEVESE
jgi:hypothetical protein